MRNIIEAETADLRQIIIEQEDERGDNGCPQKARPMRGLAGALATVPSVTSFSSACVRNPTGNSAKASSTRL